MAVPSLFPLKLSVDDGSMRVKIPRLPDDLISLLPNWDPHQQCVFLLEPYLCHPVDDIIIECFPPVPIVLCSQPTSLRFDGLQTLEYWESIVTVKVVASGRLDQVALVAYGGGNPSQGKIDDPGLSGLHFSPGCAYHRWLY